MRYALTNPEWTAIRPMLPTTTRRAPGKRPGVLNGILWICDPEPHGAPDACPRLYLSSRRKGYLNSRSCS